MIEPPVLADDAEFASRAYEFHVIEVATRRPKK